MKRPRSWRQIWRIVKRVKPEADNAASPALKVVAHQSRRRFLGATRRFIPPFNHVSSFPEIVHQVVVSCTDPAISAARRIASLFLSTHSVPFAGVTVGWPMPQTLWRERSSARKEAKEIGGRFPSSATVAHERVVKRSSPNDLFMVSSRQSARYKATLWLPNQHTKRARAPVASSQCSDLVRRNPPERSSLVPSGMFLEARVSYDQISTMSPERMTRSHLAVGVMHKGSYKGLSSKESESLRILDSDTALLERRTSHAFSSSSRSLHVLLSPIISRTDLELPYVAR